MRFKRYSAMFWTNTLTFYFRKTNRKYHQILFRQDLVVYSAYICLWNLFVEIVQCEHLLPNNTGTFSSEELKFLFYPIVVYFCCTDYIVCTVCTIFCSFFRSLRLQFYFYYCYLWFTHDSIKFITKPINYFVWNDQT